MFSERGIRRFEKANTETVMSKEFLTIKDASNKLGLPGSTNTYTFITKGAAITAGADPDLLTGYGYNDFPVDDDIQIGSTLLLRYDGPTNTFTRGAIGATKKGTITAGSLGATFSVNAGYNIDKITTDDISKTWSTFRLFFRGQITGPSDISLPNFYPMCSILAYYGGTDRTCGINVIRKSDGTWWVTFRVINNSTATAYLTIDLFQLPSATQGFTAIVDLKSDGNIYHNSSYSDNSAGVVYNTNGSITNMKNMQVILGGWSFSNPAMIVNEFKIETFDK